MGKEIYSRFLRKRDGPIGALKLKYRSYDNKGLTATKVHSPTFLYTRADAAILARMPSLCLTKLSGMILRLVSSALRANPRPYKYALDVVMS